MQESRLLTLYSSPKVDLFYDKLQDVGEYVGRISLTCKSALKIFDIDIDGHSVS